MIDLLYMVWDKHDLQFGLVLQRFEIGWEV